MGNWKTPGHRGYLLDLTMLARPERAGHVPFFEVPTAGRIEHGNPHDLRFLGGRLVIEVDYQL
ncbi:hypothetical protein [Nocardia beijingensis]|uniref:hypothetical protein n=1 Tax=Nocardia beijingensis TaxID=95162 RepID=UPI0033BAC8C2